MYRVFFVSVGSVWFIFLAILSGLPFQMTGTFSPAFKVPKLCLLSFFFIAQMM